MNMVSQTHNFNQPKRTSFNMKDPDSSSTQSTGQSCHAMVDMEGGKPQGHGISTETGCGGNYEKRNGCPTILSLGTPDFGFPPPGIDYNLSLAPIPYPYADPFFGGVLASYGSQTVMHPQMVGIGSARVPLPLNLPEEEPIYVNAKQYQGILRRRESRAKLEAQNKLVKARKPYLHESRHRHAMKRARGSGGRFLNTKQLQEMRPQKSDAQNISILSPLHLTGNLHGSLEVDRSKNNSDTSMPTTSCSEVSNMSNNIFQGQNSKFAGFRLHVGRSLHSGDNMSNGSQQYRVSVP